MTADGPAITLGNGQRIDLHPDDIADVLASVSTNDLAAELELRRIADETLGQRIRRMRRDRGWTTRDLAPRVGVAIATINRLERDITRDPGVLLLCRVAEAFDTTLTDLVEGLYE